MGESRWQEWGPEGDDQQAPPYGLLPPATDDTMRRATALDWAVNQRVARGWRVEARSESQVVLAREAQLNNVMHLFLTLLTCGLWAIVWLILYFARKKERITITVDSAGRLLTSHAPGS